MGCPEGGGVPIPGTVQTWTWHLRTGFSAECGDAGLTWGSQRSNLNSSVICDTTWAKVTQGVGIQIPTQKWGIEHPNNPAKLSNPTFWLWTPPRTDAKRNLHYSVAEIKLQVKSTGHFCWWEGDVGTASEWRQHHTFLGGTKSSTNSTGETLPVESLP